MSVTPEGKIKKLVKDTLNEFVYDTPLIETALIRQQPFPPISNPYPKLYQFWPVPNGIGASSLDCLVCYYGLFIAIEVKANTKLQPTARQFLTIDSIKEAGGIALVIGDQSGCDRLREMLTLIRFTHANNNQR